MFTLQGAESGSGFEEPLDLENIDSFNCRYASMAARLWASSSVSLCGAELRLGIDDDQEAIVDACSGVK